jgi:nicotinamidase-related amidase
MFSRDKINEGLSSTRMRHPGLADRENMALLVIDLQEKFGPVIPRFNDIIRNSRALIKTFQLFNLPIFVTEQYPHGLGKTVKEIADNFQIMEVTEKLTFSCAQNENFIRKIDNLKSKDLVVCGIEAHVCISQTVHDFLHRDYRVWIPRDAIGSRHQLDEDIAYQRMIQAGALATTTEMLLFEMAIQAGTESFKQIQALTK